MLPTLLLHLLRLLLAAPLPLCCLNRLGGSCPAGSSPSLAAAAPAPPACGGQGGAGGPTVGWAGIRCQVLQRGCKAVGPGSWSIQPNGCAWGEATRAAHSPEPQGFHQGLFLLSYCCFSAASRLQGWVSAFSTVSSWMYILHGVQAF